MGEEEHLRHMLFVYDVLLFTNGAIHEGMKLKEILYLYCKAIGMEINVPKPSIRFNGVTLGS